MEVHHLESMVTQGVLLFCVFLVILSFLRHLSCRSKLPHALWVLLFGALCGFVIILTPVFPEGLYLAPSVVFFILLPVLLFDSAMKIQYTDLKKILVPAVFLATIGVLISTALSGFSLLSFRWLGTDWGFLDVFLLGAILSATDPVSVGSLFSRFSLPKSLELLVEGESLFNDATVIVLFSLLMNLISGQGSLQLSSIVGAFMISVTGGLLIGYSFARIADAVLKRWKNDHSPFLILTVSLATCHGTFLFAEHVAHVSGVLAVVMVGLVFGNESFPALLNEREKFVRTFWDYAAFVANGLLFFYLGAELVQHRYDLNLWTIPLAILFFFFARYLAIFLSGQMLRFFHSPLPKSWQHVLSIGGLRGALSIALILSLPTDYSYRNLFLCLAFVIIGFSLTANVWGLADFLSRRKVDKKLPR